MLGVPDISRLFDDITKAASKKAEPIICNVVPHECRAPDTSFDGTTSPCCCSRREAPTTYQVSETRDIGSPMSERNWIGDFRPRPMGCSMGAPLALRRQGARRQFKRTTGVYIRKCS
jgi:hypothetical protein